MCAMLSFLGDVYRSRTSIGLPFVWCLNKPWLAWGRRQVEVFKKRDGSENWRKETEMGDNKSNHFCHWMWDTASVKGWRGEIERWRQRDWTKDHGRGGRRSDIRHPVLVNAGASKLYLYLQRYFAQVSLDCFSFSSLYGKVQTQLGEKGPVPSALSVWKSLQWDLEVPLLLWRCLEGCKTK